ncbi:MAG TPA: lipase maturation factor family protein, partial [Kofleriaceae bacterium]|nr:lipase maturation factor family protein [Kofleriaceae bacterium]
MTAPGDGEPIASDWSRFWRALTVSRYQYQLTRFVILRLLGLVWLLAFLGVALQMRPLFGSHGLTPARDYLELLRANGYGFHRFPTLFWLSTDDTFMQLMAWLGVALSLALLLGWANLPQLLLLWFLYLSFIVVGQDWYGYGWEMQLCETGYLCAFLAAPLDPRPLPARRPALIAIVLLRWLAIRIMLGAGLIKLRGDACWRDLTCLDYHFETQPLPNPFSPSFHVLPHAALAGGVLYNHLCEVVSPLLAFGPRLARLIAGTLMLSFQTTLIVTGNLSFLNLLTIVPILACFDDRFLRRLMPARLRAWIDRR